MRTILPASLAAAVAIVTACSGVREKSFEKDVEAYREEVGNVGLAVAVVKDGEIVYHKQFGVKNLQTQEPIAEDDLFRIASISKSFSATSIMQLKEKGLVTLDTDVSSLAGFPIRNPRYPEKVITLEMLLSHTSSLNDSEGYFTLDAINPATNPDWANCYNEYAPGEGYEYCNLNFNLVGSFIEKLSGERFDQYVVNHILRPLGIEGGYCVDSLDARKFVSLYNYRDGQYVEEPEAYEPRSERIAAYRFGYDTPVFSPTGGMKISALGLARYMMMHMGWGTAPDGTRIIGEEDARSMQTERSAPEHYGLALEHDFDRIPGVELVGHTGSAYGLRSAMFWAPDRSFGLVCISSGSYEEYDSDNSQILNEVLKRLYKHFCN
jgi:CubicO group peptidase (beta-lactamase class C family)